jgi:hypothetical protein
MPIAQIREKARVSSPYILESDECNMCEWQKKYVMRMTSYAQSKEQVSWVGGTGQTGAPDRSGPASTPSWTTLVRLVTLTG